MTNMVAATITWRRRPRCRPNRRARTNLRLRPLWRARAGGRRIALRAPGTIFGNSIAVPFDHTSIIATVRKRFGLSEALTARDAQAPDLDSVLTLPRPTNLGPLRLKALPYAPSPATAAVAQTKPLNSMQKALVGLAANLPPAPGNDLQTHLANLKTTRPQPAPATALASVHDARDYVKRQAGNYFQSH